MSGYCSATGVCEVDAVEAIPGKVNMYRFFWATYQCTNNQCLVANLTFYNGIGLPARDLIFDLAEESTPRQKFFTNIWFHCYDPKAKFTKDLPWDQFELGVDILGEIIQLIVIPVGTEITTSLTFLEFLEAATPGSIQSGLTVYGFSSLIQSWTRVLQELGSTPIFTFFDTSAGKWAIRKEKENIPMPCPGTTVLVQGFLASIERPEDQSVPFLHLELSVDNILFPSATCSTALPKPFDHSKEPQQPAKHCCGGKIKRDALEAKAASSGAVTT